MVESSTPMGRPHFLSCTKWKTQNNPPGPWSPNPASRADFMQSRTFRSLPIPSPEMPAELTPGLAALTQQLPSLACALSHVPSSFCTLTVTSVSTPTSLVPRLSFPSLISTVISYTCSPFRPVILSAPSPPVPSTCRLLLPLFHLPVSGSRSSPAAVLSAAHSPGFAIRPPRSLPFPAARALPFGCSEHKQTRSAGLPAFWGRSCHGNECGCHLTPPAAGVGLSHPHTPRPPTQSGSPLPSHPCHCQ